MSQRRVAQVLLLFTCPCWQERLELAFVSWFETKRTADPNSGLYLVGRTTKYTVISVKDIERPVHLIPKFGSQVGTTTKVKRELGHAWQIFENQRQNSTHTKHQSEYASNSDALNGSDFQSLADDAGSQSAPVLDAMSYYKEFWLNSWIDDHMYKLIY